MSEFLQYHLYNALSFAQIMGYLAFFFGVLAFSQKVDLRLKVFSALECVVLAVHFYLLGNMTAMLMTGISAVRNTTAIYAHNLWMAVLFLCLSVPAGIYTAEHWYSALIITSQITSTVALFTMRGLKMRYVFAFGTVCWMINNFLSVSYGGFALEMFILIANIRVIRVMRRERKARRA
ncbi:MAG: YgjV family protein, partial [Methylobacteriaceae bacterium]|nr:YgjV family protein [Methylobacteriaceae bacterium]